MSNILDVLEVPKSGYSLIMENKKVRVMDMKLKPGDKSPMHNHPNDHVVYVFNNAKFKLSFPNGNSDEFELKAGQALWIDAGPHETENIGNTNGHNLVTEIK
ncbi:cupin domain-containing protein [Methanobacterium sp. SMA-27]|uniref:cupin domain-containing protein n=1 Tax=Methanobacterium sp. SMA-27 TaxID=1495336 RepID=UPI00064F4E31|nr:cupin domain-containing protein [Methanobacterium sp. SMA-27]